MAGHRDLASGMWRPVGSPAFRRSWAEEKTASRRDYLRRIGFAMTADHRYIVAMELAEVTCPTCFEVFEVAVPHPDEMPTEVDYDCEICCRPMIIVFTENEVYAKGLGE